MPVTLGSISMDRAVVEVTWETARNWIRYIFSHSFCLCWLRRELRKSLFLSVCVCVCVRDICEFFTQSSWFLLRSSSRLHSCLSAVSQQCLSSVSAVSQQSLSSLSAVCQQSVSSLLAVCQQSVSSLSEVSQRSFSSLLALSLKSLALSSHIHFIILRAYFITSSAEHKILCLVLLHPNKW